MLTFKIWHISLHLENVTMILLLLLFKTSRLLMLIIYLMFTVQAVLAVIMIKTVRSNVSSWCHLGFSLLIAVHSVIDCSLVPQQTEKLGSPLSLSFCLSIGPLSSSAERREEGGVVGGDHRVSDAFDTRKPSTSPNTSTSILEGSLWTVKRNTTGTNKKQFN